MTPLRIAALKWFYDHGPIGWFDRHAPTERMRKILLNDGLIERLPRQDSRIQVVKYQLTHKGAVELDKATAPD